MLYIKDKTIHKNKKSIVALFYYRLIFNTNFYKTGTYICTYLKISYFFNKKGKNNLVTKI